MAKVFYSKQIQNILKNLDYSRLGDNVGIKVHFGEKGCITYLNPKIVKTVYEKIISLGKKATLIETNVLYGGSRTKKVDHLRTAKEHGFDFAPIDILDGEKGEEFIEVEVGLDKLAKLGKGLEKYDSLVVISHFKGHPMAGFGGAFKNIGMGLASRGGKLHMHSNVSPRVVVDKCTACGICAENCDSNAIIINEKAEIDLDKCTGCSMCIAVCPQKAISIPWGALTTKDLQERIINYCNAVFKVISKDKMIFINVLENITKDCDCFDYEQKPIIEDIGILVSEDILSIDQASLDLVNSKLDKNLFEITPDGNPQLDCAEKLGLGQKNYEIIDLDEKS